MQHFRKLPCADERNIANAPIVNCIAASGVNIARAATDGAIPATDAEVIALRHATGDTQGSENLLDLRTGMAARYGWHNLVIDNSWAKVNAGLKRKTWIATYGWYSRLPNRMKNPGQRDVVHCIAVGPDSPSTVVIVDPIFKPRPIYRVASFDELHKFMASGGFINLAIEEYSRLERRGHVSVVPGNFFVYSYSRGVWTRRVRDTGGFSADTSLAATYTNVVGHPTLRMAQIRTGFLTGYWLNTTGDHITYTEIKV